jgi:DNA-binding CsgD family transcriptional regulator
MATPQERDEAARMARRILREMDRDEVAVSERERVVLRLMADGRLEEAQRLGHSSP